MTVTIDLAGSRALVTGSSRGIGRAVAITLARAGARVAVHYSRDEASARETLASLHGDGHLLVQGDVADPDRVHAMVADVAAGLGGLDILVNNAGVYVEHALPGVAYEQWQEAWRRTIDVNLLGPAWLTWCAVEHMLGRGGRVVNISSRGAFRGEPKHPAYGASKAGLNAMGQSLARALAPHRIYVTTIAPGWVDTDMAAEAGNRPQGDALSVELPTGRLATPEEIANTVLFVVAPGSEQLTGTIIDVNGASYLRS
jgi:NAD(P)-dependent dehydrogenase (short-subunit alcohol dehydrogenase family)